MKPGDILKVKSDAYSLRPNSLIEIVDVNEDKFTKVKFVKYRYLDWLEKNSRIHLESMIMDETYKCAKQMLEERLSRDKQNLSE